MTHAILIMGPAAGGTTADDGRYLMDFDVAQHDGRGPIPTTDKIEEARHFPTPADAINFWRTQSVTRPCRPDGEANRPLTAYSVELVRVADPEHVDNVGEIAMALLDVCQTIGKLDAAETISALAGAIGLAIAETTNGWIDDGWDDITTLARNVCEERRHFIKENAN